MKRFLIILIAVIMIINSSVFSQSANILPYNYYDFSFLGGGARAEGMGKAFIAVSDDITGGSWNPAGIHEFEKPTIGLSWSSLNPKGKSNIFFFQPSESNHSGAFSSISSLNFVAPIRIKNHPFVLSFNYARNFAIFDQFASEESGSCIQLYPSDIFGTIIDTIDFLETRENKMDGGLYALNFAMGTRLFSKWSFGLSINIYLGRSLRVAESHVTLYDFLDQRDLIQRGLYEQLITVTDTNKFSGTNFTIGFKHNGEKLDFGFIVRTPFKLNSNRQEAIYRVTTYNELITEIGTDTIYIGDLLLKYEMPIVFGAGVSYQVTDDFMIIARIESLILKKGVDDALTRAIAYIHAGADGIMIHSKKTDGKHTIIKSISSFQFMSYFY